MLLGGRWKKHWLTFLVIVATDVGDDVTETSTRKRDAVSQEERQEKRRERKKKIGEKGVKSPSTKLWEEGGFLPAHGGWRGGDVYR